MGTGKDGMQKEPRLASEPVGENSGPGLCGLTLRHTVVVGVAAYAFVVAVIIGSTLIISKSVTSGAARKSVNDLGYERIAISQSTEASSANAFSGEKEIPFHSAIVFGLNYEEMMAKFKIFAYPAEEHTFHRSSEGGLVDFRNTDELFAHLLFQSQFVTLDAENAHLLFLPISTRSLVDDKRIGPGKIGKVLNQYIQRLRDTYPYWWRTLGADHVFVNCLEAKEDGSRNVLELKKNAIQIACSPLAAGEGFSQVFYPHKDIAMPLCDTVSMDDNMTEIVIPFQKRSKLAYYHGSVESISLYRSRGVPWERDTRFIFAGADLDIESHKNLLSTSKFCLFLAREDYPNLLNALKFGCVPVIFSDGRLFDLPFQDVLDWNRFTVVVSQKNMEKLPTLLAAFDEERYATMQTIARKATTHLQWHNPPQEKDAFYMVLYDLWVRRHAVRYVRRDLKNDEL